MLYRKLTIAAVLTGLMILLFLGSWRSTIIVCLSIPLSILVSLIVLRMMGHTINVMTLGGLALAVGILVDDATVEIENTHRNLAMKKTLVKAVLDCAQQIAAPAFVSTTAICVVDGEGVRIWRGQCATSPELGTDCRFAKPPDSVGHTP